MSDINLHLNMEKWSLAYNVWMEYFYETSRFERRINSSPNEYKSIPIEGTPLQIIQSNQMAWWTYTNHMQKHLDIDDEIWQNARDNAFEVEWVGLVKWNENRAKIVN